MSGLSLAVGQTIELNDGRRAVIRFLGTTGFAPGEWIGVELDDHSGKNDGSVKGDRYFECEPNNGMFLREAGVGKILAQPKSQQPHDGPTPRTSGNGPAMGRTRPTSINISSTLGRGAGMESRRRESAILSPSKSPTKQIGTGIGSNNATMSRPGAPRRPVSIATTSTSATTTASSVAAKARPDLPRTPSLPSKRASVVPSTTTSSTPARHTSRPSISGSSSGVSRAPARTAPARQSLAPLPRVPSNNRLSAVSSHVSDSHDSRESQGSQLSLPSPAEEGDPIDQRASSPPAALPSRRTSRGTAAPSRELEDLQAKMRIIERKRLEDRERLKKMAEIEQERDKYASLTQKLQSKMQNQSQELVELRKLLKESETSLLNIEAIQEEHDAVVEMATLDREMAEETAEVLRTEVEALRSKNEEISLELEILKEENQELGREMSPEERTGQGWLQLERSNERLREALMRLRDITQEQEAELKDQISVLEDEVQDFARVKTEYEDMKEKLLGTEAHAEDLRQQLDAALGAEDMIEELTERNMTLQEQIDEMKVTIEDLESLRELNDELEINHVEAEKQMQEEIDFKETLLSENLRRTAQYQQTIEDCEYTISRFRDLVTSMQSDLEDMRASQQITDKEAEDLSNRSRAMLDLNMKLQISASKTQVKTIDLELRRLEAQEASEHLAIVQLFLPDAYNIERDSVLALLRFKRVAFKANLVQNFIKERISSQTVNLADSNLFAACSVMDRLACVSAMADRFVNSICGCTVEDFAKYEGALYELEPVERALNNYIDALKRQELDESKVDGELQRSMAVMSHLASLHIRESSATFTDELLMQTSAIQSHLETIASAFSLCKASIEANVPNVDEEEMKEGSNEPGLLDKLDAFISITRSAKVITGKSHRAISDLQSRSLALEPSTMDIFTSAEQGALKLLVFTRSAGETLQAMFGEEGREDTFTTSEINLALSRLSNSVFELPTPEPSTMATVAKSLRSLTDQLAKMSALSVDLDNTTEFERLPSPWVIRSAEIRATKSSSAETKAEVARLTEIVRDRTLLVRTKEQELEEQGVRIEMLEARMAEAQKRSAQLGELEMSLRTFKETEQGLRDELADAEKEVQRLSQELEEARQQAAENQVMSQDAYAPNVDIGGGASRVELDRAKAQEKNLKAAIRYLQRQTTSTLTMTATGMAPSLSSSSDLDWLEEPLLSKPSVEKRRLDLLEAETKSAIHELLNVVVKSEPIKIGGGTSMGAAGVGVTTTSKNRLAWRPAQETIAWATRKRREEWENWREWQVDLVERARKEGITFDGHDDGGVGVGAGRVVIVGEEEE